MKIKVEVKKHHLEEDSNPIQNALYGLGFDCSIDSEKHTFDLISPTYENLTKQLPSRAIDFLNLWENGKDVEPFHFFFVLTKKQYEIYFM